MDWMRSAVGVVDHNFYKLPLLNNVRVGVTAIYYRVRGILACAEGSVQSWDLGRNVCQVVEGGPEYG
jgi:hypothetical protein